MNTYLSSGQPTFPQHEPMKAVRTHRYLAASHLAARERQLRYQAEADVNRLLNQSGVAPKASASRVSSFRQLVDSALVRARRRLAGGTRNGTVPEKTSAAGTLGVRG